MGDPSPPPQDHGGNAREVQATLGLDDLVDFSASINPMGVPDGLRERVEAAWGEVSRYPDRANTRLRAAAADRHGVSPDRVVAGNGSAELIDLLLRASGAVRLVVCPPDFGLYRELAPGDLPVHAVPRAPDTFLPDPSTLIDTSRPGDLVLFSNPGNPAGTTLDRDTVAGLARDLARKGALLAVDEAFADFCPEVAVTGRDDALVLRSLTKFYGIQGLRVGYAVGPVTVVAAMARLQVPWSVGALAHEAGCHCLAAGAWADRARSAVDALRDEFARALARLDGVRPVPSRANYLLLELRPPAPGATATYHALARRGVLVRHCGSFGLGERYLRVAVRTAGENRRLVDALAAVIGSAP